MGPLQISSFLCTFAPSEGFGFLFLQMGVSVIFGFLLFSAVSACGLFDFIVFILFLQAEYSDLKTIWERANDAVNTIIRRDESTESGEFLEPCIEGMSTSI